MPEMPHTSQDHGNAMFVRGSNHFVVAHRAAGLNHGFDAKFGGGIQSISEGKYASEAMTQPLTVKPSSLALIAAIRVEYTRLICPAPTPMVMLSCANTMAFDFTNLQTFQATASHAIPQR